MSERSVNLFHWILVAILLRMNAADNFERKNTDNFDNEVDQRSDELLYMSAAET